MRSLTWSARARRPAGAWGGGRLPKTLRETLDYLKERQRADPKFTYEIIVVDDGSPDATSASVRPFIKEVSTERLRVLRLLRNRGKGGAVTAGVLRARGEYILFADADGATAVHEIANLERQVKQIEKDGLAVGIGSRAHLVNTDVVVKVRGQGGRNGATRWMLTFVPQRSCWSSLSGR